MAELDICEMPSMTTVAAQSRKEKRKILKKMKRSQFRTETAIKEREEEESRLNDSEVQFLLKLQQEEEAKKAERERAEFEERERLWLEAAAARKSREDQRLQKLLEEQERKEKEHAYGLDADDEYESLDEGPAEIIWKGNEIIVKRRRVKAAKRIAEQISNIEDDDRPTSNSFPPQSAALASFVLGETVTGTEMIDSFVEQVPNFGTEQDKAHCPFHLKTGACRFGSRCSRAHFYPEKSCTLLLKNMYNGPGLSCEQDEGLEVCQLSFLWLLTEIYVNVCSNDDLKLQAWLRTETSHFASYTDEEVECSYEEFYEDVHTEFLKFGEIINFKVCKNSSYHLKGNVYVHYKSLESAFLAFSTMNLRYYAGKQIMCEFVGVTRWKVAICGEYMRSRLKTCSHGSACNFIHCFRNPGGEYEWADWDNPPPRYWIKKMIFLFGTSVESSYDLDLELEDYKRHIELKRHRESRRLRGPKSYRHQSERSHCIEMDLNSSSFEELHDVDEGTTSQKIIEGSPKNHRRTVTNLPEHDRRHENYFRRTRKVYSEEHENSDCNSRNKSHKKQEKMNYDPLEGSDSCRGRSRSPSKRHFFSRHSTQDRIYEKYSSEDLDSDTDSASASRYHYDRRDKLSTRRHRSLRSREHQYVSSKVRKGQRN